MEEQPPALLLFTKLGPVDWTTTEFLFPLFSLEASKLLTLLVNLWIGSSSLIMGIFRLVYRVCWYSKIAILPQMCSKIVWIWYFGVCLKLTIFSRPNIFFSFFQRSFLFDIWEFAWSWQPTTVAEFQIGAKWSSTAHQRENFKLQILEILRNIHKITNKMFCEWSVRKALSQNG